jgi:hypothetical protein
MQIRDALGLGSPEGRTVIPVSVWLPLAVAMPLVVGLVAGVLDASGGVVLALAALAAALVIPAATAIVLRRDRRNC